jgi:hypothetical protein
MSTPGTMTKVPGTVLQTNMSVIQTPFVSQHRGGDGRISECCDTCGIPYVTALDMNLVKNLRTIGFCTTKARVLGLYSLSQSHFKRPKVHPWLPMTLALFFERFQRHAPYTATQNAPKMKSGLVFKNQSGLDNGIRRIPWMAPQCTIYMDGSPQ